MKNHSSLVLSLVLLATALVLWLVSNHSSDMASLAMAAVVVPGVAGGKHVVEGPLTTSLTEEASPGLLRNEIDRRVTKIRPSSTPIDQITRCAGARACGSMVVDYYSVDTRPSEALLSTVVNSSTPSTVMGNAIVYNITTNKDAIFEPSETILVPNIKGYTANDTPQGSLVLYVVGRGASRGLQVIAVNGHPSAENPAMRTIPGIPAGSQLVRMGRAAAELDVQTAQFNALPVKSSNYCQIFKAQVEESTYQKIANKEVGWTFNDQEEVAIIDMRMGMERNFLFGSKARIYDPEKQDEIMLTGGIWNQAGADFDYTLGDGDEEPATDSTDFILGLTRLAFTGNSGSKRKILLAGSALIEYLNRMDYTRSVSAGESVTHWGIDFRELHSKFGTLYVVHSEVFDSVGCPGDGMVIDPEYMTKYSHVPMRAEHLDLKKSGVRNTSAVVVTEASCVVLRYPRAHVRVNCI